MLKYSLPVILLLTIFAAAQQATAAEPIVIPSAWLRLVEQVEVPAQEQGVLAAIHAREGQLVKRDDLLAQLEATDSQLELRKAELEADIARREAENDVKVRYAKKSLEVAQAELRRADESIKRYPKSISPAEIDRLKLVVGRSQLELEQAEHDRAIAASTQHLKENEVRRAKRQIERRQMRAPFAGLVVGVPAKLGEWVEPGKKVVRIVRIDRLRAEGFIAAKKLTQDLTRRKVRYVVDLPGKPDSEFPAKIVFVSPEVSPVNGQVRIWAEIDNKQGRLRPGLRGKLVIE